MRDVLIKSLIVTLLTLITSFEATMAQEFNASARFQAAKSKTQKNFAKQGLLNNQRFNVHQSYARKVIIGTMINRKNIYAAGERVHAAGTRLNVGAIENHEVKNKKLAGKDKHIMKVIAGERADVEGNKGSVYLRVNTINNGNITANASGSTIAEAQAAGGEIIVKGARGIVDIRTHSISRGNITSSANARSNVRAGAATLQVNVQDKPRSVQLRGKIAGHGHITAQARGGVISALKMSGEQ